MNINDELHNFLFVSRRWTNRGKMTSIERFADYLAPAHIEPSGCIPTRPARLLRWMSRRTGNAVYSSHSVGIEVSCLKALVARRPRAVHFLYGEYDLYYTAWLCGMIGLPCFASFHNPPSNLEERLVNRKFLKSLTGVVILGRNQRPFFEAACPGVPVGMIPLGVDSAFFSPDDHWPVPPPGPATVLIVGMHLRDWDTITRVVKILKDRRPNIQVVSSIPNGSPGIAQFRSDVVNRHPVTDVELRDLYRSATASLYVPLDCVGSNAVVESLACGVPIVTSETGAIRDYVGEDCAEIVPPGDAEAMAAAICRLVDDPARRSLLAISARTRGVGLDWNNIKAKYKEFFRECLNKMK